MDYKMIRLEQTEGIAVITLDYAPTLNALDMNMSLELEDADSHLLFALRLPVPASRQTEERHEEEHEEPHSIPHLASLSPHQRKE